MQTDIIVSGFGGQGVLFAGQLLAYAAMDEGREVTWIPSYGPEMRGGTANCTVVISDDEIGSPLARNPQAVVSKTALGRRLQPLGEPLEGSAIEVHMSNLRRKIGAHRIRTLRGVGYQLIS